MKRFGGFYGMLILMLGALVLCPGQAKAVGNDTTDRVAVSTIEEGEPLYEDTYVEGTAFPEMEGMLCASTAVASSSSAASAAGFQRLGDSLTGMAAQVYRACGQLDPGESVTIVHTVARDESVIELWQDFLKNVYRQGLMAYKYDHPEKTDWTGSRIYASCSYDLLRGQVTFSCRYEKSSYYTSTGHTRMIRRTQEAAAACRQGDRYEQICALNRWLVEQCTYDQTVAGMSSDDGSRSYWLAHSPMGCLTDGSGVCESYAKTVQMVCNLLDIPCIIVGGSSHVWNYIGMEDGRWYLLDTTWNDTCGNAERYLLTSTDRSHMTDAVFSYPAVSTSAYTPVTIRVSEEDAAGADLPAAGREDSAALSEDKNDSLYPVLKKLSNTSRGVKLVWEAQDGMHSYQVYRRMTSSSWEMMAVTEAAEYVDTTAVSGKRYVYTVRGVDNEGELGMYDPDGLEILALDPIGATNLKTVNTYAGIKITWKAVSGAQTYRIYRRTPTGSYKRIAVVDAAKTQLYVDSTAVNGNRYYYAVRACSGTTLGGYSGRTHLRLESVALTTVSSAEKGELKVFWRQNAAVGGYQIRISESASFGTYRTVTVPDSRTAETVLNGLSAGRKMYVKIRGWKTVCGVKYYSGWSSAKCVTVALT